MSLASLSYKQLQALAKKNGISAKQKTTELIAALQLLPEFSGKQSDNADADDDDDEAAAAAAMADEPEPAAAPAKRGRGRPAAKKTAAAVDEDDTNADEAEEAAAVAAAPAAKASRKRATTAAAPAPADDTDMPDAEAATAPVETAASRKSKKSKHSHAAPPAQDAAAAADEDEPAPVKDRVTKRGRRPKRVTTSGEDDAPATAAATRDSLTQQQQAAASRRNSANTNKQQHTDNAPAAAAAAAEAAQDDPSPSHARGPRPSVGPRKRWTQAPVELFGGTVVLVPPVAAPAAPPTAATHTRASGRWAQVSDELPEPQPRRKQIMSPIGGHGPLALAPAALQDAFRAQHSSPPSNSSPSRSSALLAAARSALSSPTTHGSGSRGAPAPQLSAYSPHRPERQSSALVAATLGVPLQVSPLAPLSSARTNGPEQVHSRLSFSQFSPEKIAAAAAAHAHSPSKSRTASPIKKLALALPQTLFSSAAYHTTAAAPAAAAAGGAAARPATAAAASQNRGPVSVAAKKQAAAAAAASSKGRVAVSAAAGRPAELDLSKTAAAGSVLFSRDARNRMTGGGALAGGKAGPAGSPTAAAASRKSFATSMPHGSPLAGAVNAAAAQAAAKPKFDLQASLQRPIGWNLKTGPVRTASTGAGAAAAGAAAPAAAAGAASSNPNRTTQLKAKTFVSTKPAQRAAADKQQANARQSRMQQARHA